MPGTQREVEFRFLAEPSDVNFGGKVHGGMVMKWIDQAGYACAVGWSGSYCVTVAVGGIQFVAPIHIGDLVRVRSRLVLTGRSSMHVATDVLARDLKSGDERLATHCLISFVALDAPNGKATAVPAWEPANEADRLLADYAANVLEISRRVAQETAHLHVVEPQRA